MKPVFMSIEMETVSLSKPSYEIYNFKYFKALFFNLQGHLLLNNTSPKVKDGEISRKLVLFQGFEQNNFNMYTTCVTRL